MDLRLNPRSLPISSTATVPFDISISLAHATYIAPKRPETVTVLQGSPHQNQGMSCGINRMARNLPVACEMGAPEAANYQNDNPPYVFDSRRPCPLSRQHQYAISVKRQKSMNSTSTTSQGAR
jgi:hypothetical protein